MGTTGTLRVRPGRSQSFVASCVSCKPGCTICISISCPCPGNDGNDTLTGGDGYNKYFWGASGPLVAIAVSCVSYVCTSGCIICISISCPYPGYDGNDVLTGGDGWNSFFQGASGPLLAIAVSCVSCTSGCTICISISCSCPGMDGNDVLTGGDGTNSYFIGVSGPLLAIAVSACRTCAL